MQSLSKVDKIKHCTKIRSTLEGAFQKSDLTSQIIAGPVILTITNAFFQEFFINSHLLHERYLRFHRSGWIVLIKSEILIMTGTRSGRSVLTNGKCPVFGHLQPSQTVT